LSSQAGAWELASVGGFSNARLLVALARSQAPAWECRIGSSGFPCSRS